MVIKCKNGHWYDGSVYPTCPHCETESGQIHLETSVFAPGFGMGEEEDEEKTIAFGFDEEGEVSPVVGWLVCIAGEGRGKDYRLHSGKNYIGRDLQMDVNLQMDTKVSRNKHGSVSYDPKGNRFYLTPEMGNMVYRNEELVSEAVLLEEGDRIQFGETTLVFIPYCKEERQWIEEENRDIE